MIDWLDEAIQRQALPKHLRQESVEEFCARNGTNIKAYYYQLSKEENKKKILEVVLNTAKDAAPEIMDVLVQKAKDGDIRSIEIYIDSILRLAKQLDITTKDLPIPLLNVLNNHIVKEDNQAQKED